MRHFLIALTGIFLLSGCVAKRYLTQAQNHVMLLQSDSSRFVSQVSNLKNQVAGHERLITDLNKKISALSSQNTALGARTEEQMSQLSESQQELARREQELTQQQQRLKELQDLLNSQKAASDQLKNKMSEALKGFSSSELTVHQKNGKVYVSLSENLLFPSGSAEVNPKGVDALSKLAAVLNLNDDVAVNIEGHTDSIPIRGRYKDNWELSTARANSIVRILVNNYKVDPTRVIASGHSYYDPVESNATAEGRASNRRTEIILTPKLEEMYQLLEKYE